MARLLLALLATLGLGRAAEPVTLAGRAMGTTWSAKFLPAPPPAPALDPALVTTRLAATLEHLETLFSTYRPDSALSRFNASSSTDWYPVSPEIARVAHEARRISDLTGGAFDVTLDPLIRLWGFGPAGRRHTLPSDTEIAAARGRVDYRRLSARLAPPALRKSSPELSADFSSLAKGFAADTLSDLLTALGAPDHFIQIGGDIQTAGAHVWRAGIASPSAPATPVTLPLPAPPSPPALAAVVALSGHALSTSGDSHNFLTVAGRRYGHILDPRTGRPVAGSLASVSVVHPSCATSSALATALFVLGADAGFALATREHLAALFLVRDGASLVPRATPEFARLSSSAPL
jgi:thiamine biosynthesis lipoprotein